MVSNETKQQKRVLFVDDEPNILSAIKRMLRSIRKDFEFHFAESGLQALAIMDQNAVDIVVSDMRMPGMDGAQLLAEVQQRSPQTIRIMLTGQANEEAIMRTVNIVHQLLAKPCEPDKLKEVLIRSAALHDIVTNAQLKRVASAIDTLPSLPSIYSKLQQVLKNPDTVLDDVAAIIEQDVAMTAKMLQLVNSSFFGMYQKVESPARAVKLLGLDTIKSLALGMQIFSEIEVHAPELTIEYLWKHSITVAHCSKQIAMQATNDDETINTCFIAGLLHDIGRLLFISKLSEEYVPVILLAQEKKTLLSDEEAAAFKTTHAHMGAYLIGLWGFQNEVIEAIAFHNSLNNYQGTRFSAAIAVHIADYCYYSHNPGDIIGAAPPLNREYFSQHGWGEMLEHWLSIGQKAMENCVT